MVVEDTQLMIRDMRCFGKLKSKRVSLVIPFFFDMEWIYFCMMLVLSIPFRPRTKAAWKGKTRLVSRGQIRATMIFVTIL